VKGFAPFKSAGKSANIQNNLNLKERKEKNNMALFYESKRDRRKIERNLAVLAVTLLLSFTAFSNLTTISVNAGGNSTSLKTMVNNELNWLTTQEATSGSYAYWTYNYPTAVPNVGSTALCVLDYINYGILPPNNPKELDWILSMQLPDGSIVSNSVDGRSTNKVYDTSLAILALVAANQFLGYNPAGFYTKMDNAMRFLLNAQCVHPAVSYVPPCPPPLPEDTYTYTSSDKFWGGWGYPQNHWADLSNTQFAVLALGAASLWINVVLLTPTVQAAIAYGAPVWANAAIFAVNCLNNKAYNPLYATLNDGGFSYQPGGYNPFGTSPSSYASMTGAGIWVTDICRNRGITSVSTGSLSGAEGLGLWWLNINNDNWAQNYPNGQTFYYYYVLSVSKAFLFSTIPFGTWLYGTNQMYDQLNSLKIVPSPGQYKWSNPSDPEETDVFSTASASLACECGFISSISPYLNVILASHASLWITDPEGRHIGINPANGQLVNEIPSATYVATTVVNVTIPDPLPGVYDVILVGTGNGAYNLTTYGSSGGSIYYPQSFSGTISQHETQEYFSVASSTIGPLTVITTPGSPPVPTPQGGVGGIIVSIDKFGLLAPYIGLASTIMIGAVATVLYVKRVKRRKEKQ
jgi:hypothetical protein